LTSNDTSTSTVEANSPIKAAPPPIDTIAKQEKCSALACHLFSHVKHLQLNTKAEVACCHIKVNIIWRKNPITLLEIASTKSCRRCAAEQMVIVQNFGNAQWNRRIINFKSKIR
jgi:hypothetical protein